MAHRQFADAHGSVWAVWDVRPSQIVDTLAQAQTERGRSSRPDSRGPLEHSLADGWLCFESGAQKLRLAPIPPSWEVLGADALALLCTSATAVHRTRRRNEEVTSQASQQT